MSKKRHINVERIVEHPKQHNLSKIIVNCKHSQGESDPNEINFAQSEVAENERNLRSRKALCLLESGN